MIAYWYCFPLSRGKGWLTRQEDCATWCKPCESLAPGPLAPGPWPQVAGPWPFMWDPGPCGTQGHVGPGAMWDLGPCGTQGHLGPPGSWGGGLRQGSLLGITPRKSQNKFFKGGALVLENGELEATAKAQVTNICEAFPGKKTFTRLGSARRTR